jgi:hypothetical protein
LVEGELDSAHQMGKIPLRASEECLNTDDRSFWGDGPGASHDEADHPGPMSVDVIAVECAAAHVEMSNVAGSEGRVPDRNAGVYDANGDSASRQPARPKRGDG